MAAKVVKMCDLSVNIAAKVFEMLNPGKVEVFSDNWLGPFRRIQTDVEPRLLIYPEGWYYAKGCFRNKHTSSTGLYEEIRMVTKDGVAWKGIAQYCTLDD